ncbi:MAG: AtpZ/AtpI family protein [Planctomycetes bacterium]|nr:AtpZ/AtpI family protein [Planctomycetota bacterium]
MIPAISASECRWLSQSGDDRPTGAAPSGEGGAPPPPSPYSGIGAAYTLAGSVVAGLVIGWSIDHATGTSPRWTVAVTMLFLGVGLYQLVREALRK